MTDNPDDPTVIDFMGRQFTIRIADEQPDPDYEETQAARDEIVHRKIDEASTLAYIRMKADARAREIIADQTADLPSDLPLDGEAWESLQREPLEYFLSGPVLRLAHGDGSKPALVFLPADTGTGKTALVCALLKAACDDEKFGGEIAGSVVSIKEGGRVVVSSHEMSDTLAYERYMRPLNIRNKKRYAWLTVQGSRVPVKGSVGPSWWVRELKTRNADVWIIDTFNRVASFSNENDNAETNLTIEQILTIARKAGVRLVWVNDHTGHGEKGRSRGGRTRIEIPDDVISYRMVGESKEGIGDGDRVIVQKPGRSSDVTTAASVAFDPTTRSIAFVAAGGSELLGEVEEEHQREAALRRAHDSLDHGSVATRTVFKDLLGGPAAYSTRLDRMIRDGLLAEIQGSGRTKYVVPTERLDEAHTLLGKKPPAAPEM